MSRVPAIPSRYGGPQPHLNGRGSRGAESGGPPLFNIEAEQGVLGSILLDPENLEAIAQIVRPADFSQDDHEQIFRAILDLAASGVVIEGLVLDDLLVSRGWTSRKATAVIGEILEKTPHGENATYYAQVVRDRALARESILIAEQLREDVRAQRDSLDRLVGRTLERYAALQSRATAGPGATPAFSLGVIGSTAFSLQRYERRWLIERVFVQGQPMIVGGPRKAMKTSIMVELVVSLASATPFLGQFVVPRPTRTLLISGESGDATIQETARRVCGVKGHSLEELEGFAFWGFVLPQLSDPEQLEALAAFVHANGIEVVVVDPLYLCLLSGNSGLDPANLFDLGPLLARISRVCLDAGATPVLVHHLRKNQEDPHAPPELEDLAYAGVQEFARQWAMVGRRETYVPGSGEHKLWLSVGGSAGHSGAWALDISEGVVDEDFRDREWTLRVVNATDARSEAAAREQAAKAEKAGERARIQDETRAKQTLEDARHLHGVMIEAMHPMTKQDLKIATKLRGDRLDQALHTVVSDWKAAEPTEVLKSCNGGSRTVDGYRLTGSNQHPATPGEHPAQHPAAGCPATPGTPGEGVASLPVGEATPVAPGVAWPGVEGQGVFPLNP